MIEQKQEILELKSEDNPRVPPSPERRLVDDSFDPFLSPKLTNETTKNILYDLEDRLEQYLFLTRFHEDHVFGEPFLDSGNQIPLQANLKDYHSK